MNGLREIVLETSRALEYLRKCLSAGHTLSRCVLETIDLDNGIVTTFLPEDGNLGNIYSFEYGGIVPEPPRPALKTKSSQNDNKAIWVPVYPVLSPVIETIRLFLVENLNRICIFEDAMSEITDPNIPPDVKLYQDEIYHLVSGEQPTSQEIEEVIYNVESIWPPVIGFLTYIPSEFEHFFKEKNITLGLLNAVAKRTEKIIVGAYDGEGYLIWHK